MIQPFAKCMVALLACFLTSVCWAADTPEELLREAQRLEKAGNVDRAAMRFEDFLTKYPTHTQTVAATYSLAKCYDNLGRVEEAITRLKVVTAEKNKKFRNRSEAFYMLGKLYASLKQHEQAAATFEALLAEGARLYEDEVLNLCGGYYAILGKTDEAAAKFNILKRKSGSPLAQDAAYKLAVLWLKNDKLDKSVRAIQDLANKFPRHKRIAELLLRAADLFRRQQQYIKTIALCEQLRKRYPKNPEALAGRYLIGLCYRDRKDYKKAVEVLDEVGKSTQFRRYGLAAEALLEAASLYQNHLSDISTALKRYGQAAALARESGGDRNAKILEQCYFQLAEHHFRQKNWAVAMENYLLLKGTGTKLNVLGRILACQAKLDDAPGIDTLNEPDLEVLREKIAANPGTLIAAEAEVFLIDQKLAGKLQGKTVAPEIADEYRKLLKKYSKQVLVTDNMQSYIHAQIGNAFFYGQAKSELEQAVTAFEQAIAAGSGANNPYQVSALESLALVADRAGQKQKSVSAYKQLLAISQAKLDKNKDDKELEKQALEYMKSLVTRSGTDDLIEQSLKICEETIARYGQLSELSREARFYMAELYYLKKDFSRAAATFRNFIRIYGPPQDDKADLKEAPWKPKNVDAKVLQVHDAAIRVAHCWYLQGHQQNTLIAYKWIAHNMPEGNKHMAEVGYWLALELGKGEQGKTRDGRLAMAETLWKNVVSTSFDFRDRNFSGTLHFWFRPGDPQFKDMQKYVKSACLKAGELFGDLKEHERAAAMFEQYIKSYARLPKGGRRTSKNGSTSKPQPDKMYDIAHYALGSQLIELDYTDRLIELYKAYIIGMRESPFRGSALQLLGYHAGRAERYTEARDAYATLLDEYGPNQYDEEGKVVPVPRERQLRQGRTNWDGIRLAPPKGFDEGRIRYALGFLYWQQGESAAVVNTLRPMLEDRKLQKTKSRDKALFMLGQSYYRMYDYGRGAQAIGALIRDHPRFEAIEEAYVFAARGLAETKQWPDLDLNYRRFVSEWSDSDRRPRMDLYAALSLIGQGKSPAGLANLKSLADGETYEDVKADACYHLAAHLQTAKPPKTQAALAYFEKSIKIYPREAACLEAARCSIELKQWEKAQRLLDRLVRDFPDGDQRVVAQGAKLIPTVLKEVAKAKNKKGS
jgi:TolA-binding protein